MFTLSNVSTPTKLMLVKDVAYAAKNGGGTISGVKEVHLLADGAMAIFTDENVMVTTTTENFQIGNATGFWIARGAPTNFNRYFRSEVIPRSASAIKKVGAIPVKMAQTLGTNAATGQSGSMNFPATLVSGSVAGVKVVDDSHPSEISATVRLYQHYVLPSDDNETIIQALVDKINADEGAIVTAAVITDTDAAPDAKAGILLTAKNFHTKFVVSGQDIIEYATITKGGTGDSVAYSPGKNSYTEMAEVGDIHDSVMGQSDTAGQNLLYSAPNLVTEFYTNALDTDTPVDTWTLQWVRQAFGPGVPRDSDTGYMTLGFVNGSTILANFETILPIIRGVDYDYGV